MSEYEPLLTFDRSGRKFALGFECGRIWALCRSDEAEISETVHAANAEMMLRIAESTGRPVESTDVDDQWIEVRFGAAA